MKYRILIIFAFLSSCSDPDLCPELNYNSLNKITTSNETPYTGRCLLLDEDGNKRSIQQYLNGVDYGKWIFYFQNGNIETKGKFNNGVRVGKWKYYHESGMIKQLSRYNRKGERVGKWIEYDDQGNEIKATIYE